MPRRLARGLTLSPQQYARVAQAALFALTLIVITGAAVRLTGSGLGCPDWPKCYGKTVPPLDTHAVIEFGNRMISGLVGLVAVAAGILAWRRRPFRRDLALLGALLPLGVLAQAVLGGFTVREHLKPGFVMSHFGLSMLILAAGTGLVWRATHEPAASDPGADVGESADAREVWLSRLLLALGAVTIFAGTAATAAGPHAGGKPGQAIERLTFMGSDTLDWTIHSHGVLATTLGIVAVGLWVWLRRRRASSQLRRAVGRLCVLLGIQGLVGALQYGTHLPAEIVWVHVTLATLTWLALLWVAATAGRPARRLAEAGAPSASARERATAGGARRVRLPA